MTIPNWLLERSRHGELDAEEQARLDQALADDPGLRRKLDALQADDERFLDAHPFDRVAPELERRAHVARTREAVARRNRALVGLAVLVPLAAAVAIAVLPGEQAGFEHEEQVRIKGDVRLVVHRQIGAETEPVRSGAPAEEGDVLQVSYVAGGLDHGVVLSIDGRGSVTLHHPTTVEGHTALSQEGEVAVPHAYKLDDAPDFERFFLVASKSPIDVERVLSAAEELAERDARTGRLDLPGELEQRDVVVLKETR